MGFLTERFPDRVARGAVGGPGYRTTVAYLPSGKNQRNIDRAFPCHEYDVSQGLKLEADWRAADRFFRKAKGRGHSFRFKDWADYQLLVADSELTQLTTTTFQLAKVYGSDEPTFKEVRNLTRLVAGTLKVFLNGVLKASPADYSVNVDTGVITFTSAPGAATRTASCDFDVPCYFEIDDRRGQLEARRNGQFFLRWENIRIREDMNG